MALCFAHLAENEQALDAFDKAIELYPDYEPGLSIKPSPAREGLRAILNTLSSELGRLRPSIRK